MIKSGIEIRRFSGQRGNNKHCTRIIQGMMPAKNLTWVKGKNNEHDLFKKSNSGRYDAEAWRDFKLNIIEINQYPILIIVDTTFDCTQARALVYEGSHRLRACAQLGIHAHVEIRIQGHARHDKILRAIGLEFADLD